MGKLETKKSRRDAIPPCFIESDLSGREADPIVSIVSTKGLSTATLQVSSRTGLTPERRTGTTITAKPKARQNTDRARERRRVLKDRCRNVLEAVEFAFQQDWPINIAITVSWDALIQAGERNEGHCLGRSSVTRDQYLFRELSRCRPKTQDDAPYVAYWVRAIGRDMGAHTHIGIFWATRPNSISALISLLERITGSPVAPWGSHSGKQNIVAESVCCGWQIKWIYGKSQLVGATHWAKYMLEHAGKHHRQPDGKAFGVSEAIGPKSRAKANRHKVGHEAQWQASKM